MRSEEMRFYTMKSICLALFSPLQLVCDAQCCEVKIHFAITYGERPLPMKNIKSLKVSFSTLGFFHEGCCMYSDLAKNS